MSAQEKIELEHHRNQIAHDVRHLVEKYRAIFDWDIPEIDQAGADRLILDAIARALAAARQELLGPRS